MIPSISRMHQGKAYDKRHQARLAAQEEKASPEDHAGGASEYIKSIVFGGLDGIITTFAVVTSTQGADLGVEVVLLVGWASLIADALSMGLGDFLSEKAEMDYVSSEQARERAEVRDHLEGEKEEVREIYRKRGMPENECIELVEIFSLYPEAFVDLMMIVELNMIPEDPDPAAWKNGLITFFSFIFCGCVPLIPYVIYYAAGLDNDDGTLFAVSCILAACVTFLLGVVKGVYSALKWYVAGTEMLIVGIIANLVAYGVAAGLKQAFGDPEIEGGHG